MLWEIIRHALGWYFGNLSQVTVVYGSLATAIIVLLSLEIGKPPPEAVPMRTEPL